MENEYNTVLRMLKTGQNVYRHTVIGEKVIKSTKENIKRFEELNFKRYTIESIWYNMGEDVKVGN